MAPRVAPSLLSKSDVEAKMTVEGDYNETETRGCTKRPAANGDVNERSRKLIKSCFGNLRSNLNVLVIGPKESGKLFLTLLN